MSSVHLAHTMKMSATGELVILERNRERREERGEREGEQNIYYKIRLRMRRRMERDFVTLKKGKNETGKRVKKGEGVRVRVRE